MSAFQVHSHNLRGSIRSSLNWIIDTMKECECTAILLQDVGETDLEGPTILKDRLGGHHMYANSSKNNKSRSVVIIIHKNWHIMRVFRDPSGSLVGVIAARGGFEVLLISAYLPPGLDTCGFPLHWDPEKSERMSAIQSEAHSIYSSLAEWSVGSPYWLVGGDLNETRSSLDSKRVSAFNRVPKFIDNFMEETKGLDVWRHLHDKSPGFTYKGSALSRLDYFLVSPLLFQCFVRPKMIIGNWKPKLDHACISLFSQIPIQGLSEPPTGRPWSIPQPRLFNLSEANRQLCKDRVASSLTKLLQSFQGGCFEEYDELSESTAQIIVKEVGQVLGLKSDTHTKGKYLPTDVCKVKGLITTISKARDLIRTLTLQEFSSSTDEKEVEEHLRVLFERIGRIGLSSVPKFEKAALLQWSEGSATNEIGYLEKYLRSRKADMVSEEKERLRRLFLDPRKRRLWYQNTFSLGVTGCPNFAINSSGTKTFNPEEVKEVYLREGTTHLKVKLKLPLVEEKESIVPEPPPNLDCPRAPPREKSWTRPKWWTEMYCRDAKGIDPNIWKDLMASASWQEVLRTVLDNEREKAAGIDGVNGDLVRLLIEDSSDEPTPLLRILVLLINQALTSGKTPLSWRKAIISMIPKRKEDGTFTQLINEMRPISVLQEFGKIASKMLAVRMGEIILKNPKVMNSAQRAFLKDGSTSQCITTALNILEDHQRKVMKNPSSTLFLLAYDQVKAYDSVQAYSIRASLERFNLPEPFISYVLCNLEDATSCFKTFYGPTKEFPVATSVRQGDPLSPLIYICVTDALHEGLRKNPLFNESTGYRFSNDPDLVVASTGYADDTMTYCESWRHQWMMHEWMREFCHKHGFQLNAAKCRYFISNCNLRILAFFGR